MAPEEPKPPQDAPSDPEPGFYVRRCHPGDAFLVGPDIEVLISSCQSHNGSLSCTIAIKAPRKTKIQPFRAR